MSAGMPLIVDSASALDADACLQVADGRLVELTPRLLHQVSEQREAALARLESGGPVYGVSTGMGAASRVALDEEQRAAHQARMLVARAVGSAPWLARRDVRAALSVRLRTFLGGDAGVSPELCSRIVEVLNLGLVPAVPATRMGAAGEILALAHLGAAVVAAPHGELRSGGDGTVPVSDSGLAEFVLGAKEGVAMIEGIPVSTARAILSVSDAQQLIAQHTAVLAAQLVLLRANRDPFRAGVARADPELGQILATVRGLAGPELQAASLQSPVSLRVSGVALAHLTRVVDALRAAITRSLDGVTDSPAFLDGEFVGTAGFDGFDLAASLDAVRFAVVRVAELGTMRIHRLLDDRVTGLGRQLSPEPGAHAGMVTVHKRSVGTLHALMSSARPAALGSIETSLGQEDAQSFSLEAAEALSVALDGARDILACELLSLVQARRLRTALAEHAEGDASIEDALVYELLDRLDALLPGGTEDRPFGREVVLLRGAVEGGWAATR